MLVEGQNPKTGSDISVLSLDSGRARRPFLFSPANEEAARFSPDDHWITYQSDESGRSEVYVTAYPGPSGRWQVSIDGGSSPVWSRDGRELFFRNRGKMMAAAVELQPKFHTGVPKPLFDSTSLGDYDVAPDGQRFVMIRTREEGATPRSISVVLGWFDDLVRRVPTSKK
jgi:hypothetical protein